jgi:hypothetical protein
LSSLKKIKIVVDISGECEMRMIAKAIGKTKDGKEVVVATIEGANLEEIRKCRFLWAIDFDGRLEVVEE